MLEELFSIHNEVMANVPTAFKRYLYPQINWKTLGLCVLGDRGVGKTTLLCQNLLERYQSPKRALYFSADHVHVASSGLFAIAKYFFDYGGEALYIDEIHKYSNWAVELKNILDVYKTKQVIFSASSSLELQKSKADLSRRVVYHRLFGLSFREYLSLAKRIEIPTYSLLDLLQNHVHIASSLKAIPLLQHFRSYLQHGYYPFFMEGISDYLSKVLNVIEKILFEDIAVIYNLRQPTLPILKRILWLVATSNGFVPNIDKISKNIGVSRETIYSCLEYLNHSGLLNELFHGNRGNRLIRKPGKILLNNSNLLAAINGSLKFSDDMGGVRETFFVNQLSHLHTVYLHEQADFLINDEILIEVGGKNKPSNQIQGHKNGYLALDDTSIGFGNKIPLYLFGLLY